LIEPCATADPSGQHISFRYIWTRAAIARAALNDNHHVVAAARNSNGIHDVLGGNTERLLPVTLDVTDGAAAEAAVAKAVDAFGRIDVLVNNAGYGQLGAFEEVSPDDIEKQFATNVFGLMNVTRAVLPVMRKQRSGYVFNMSSAAGYKGGDRYSIYDMRHQSSLSAGFLNRSPSNSPSSASTSRWWSLVISVLIFLTAAPSAMARGTSPITPLNQPPRGCKRSLTTTGSLVIPRSSARPWSRWRPMPIRQRTSP